MPGPPDWESWFEIFRCVRATFLLLEAMSAERMDAYAEHLRQLASRFGSQCWDLVYTADVHMSEQFERIRRRLSDKPDFGYSDADPWNAVMAQAIKEDSFWTREVITPATLRLAQARSIPAPLSQGKPGLLSESERDQGTPKKKRKKVRESDDKSKHNGQTYTHNRRGVEICSNWNQGKCGKTQPQSSCSNRRSHQCNVCLGPHQATNCKSPK